MRVLLLSKYGRKGASSRLRSFQYLPYFENAGLRVEVCPLFEDWYIDQLYGGKVSVMAVLGAYYRRLKSLLKIQSFDVIWIEKEALPWLPAFFEEAFLVGRIPYVLDFDDAVFHRYDLNSRGFVRRLLGNKIDKLMAKASLVTGGNDYLCDRATQAGAKWVEKIPTVVDLNRYRSRDWSEPKMVVGWIGSPSTAKYLKLIEGPIRSLVEQHGCEFWAVGANEQQLKGMPVKAIPWEERTEVELIRMFDVGIMPLVDEPFERGKCGYKLIQYMACGVPVVGSPVGVNVDIVSQGVTGFLALNADDWISAVSNLLVNRDFRIRAGDAGRKLVEDVYSLQVMAPKLIGLFNSVARGG